MLVAKLAAGKADPAGVNRQYAQTAALLAKLKQQRVLAELGGR